MTLLSGDLTTPARYWAWTGSTSAIPANVPQFITSMTALIYGKINRTRLYSRPITNVFDGTGTYQLVLPDYPVTSISKVQLGPRLIQPYPLPNATTGAPVLGANFGYGYRFVAASGQGLPGDVAVLEFVNGIWTRGAQNLQVTYTAGYVVQGEAQTIPGTPFQVTVLQPLGIWCRDNGVVYAATGVALTPVTSLTGAGQYIPPPDTSPGLYTFDAADAAEKVLISYSFIPADLEEACIQMVAERRAYTSRIGEISKSLGGQETIRYMRGGNRGGMFPDLPPEVEALISPYVRVIPPAIGAPV